MKMMILMKLLKNHPKATQMVSRLLQNHFGLYEQQVASRTGGFLAGSELTLGRVFIRVQEEKKGACECFGWQEFIDENSEVASDLWHLQKFWGELCCTLVIV